MPEFYKSNAFILIASILFSLILGAAGLEVYFQKKYWHDVNTRFDDELGWAPMENRSVVQDGKTYSNNARGFRSQPVRADRGHVLMLGDSTVWGYGVNDDETLPYYLNEKLNDPQVLNLGVSGYGIDQYFLFLNRHIEKLNPKAIVVTLFTGNDFLDTVTDSRYGKSKPLFTTSGNAGIQRSRPGVSQYSCHNVFSKSWILSLQWFQPYRRIICSTTTLGAKEGRYVVSSLIAKITELASSHGSELIFILLPSRVDLKFKMEEAFNMASQSRSVSRVEFMTYNAYLLLRKILSDADLPYIDFMEVLRKHSPNPESLYLDIAHLTPAGNQLLANAVYDHLMANPVS